MSATNYRNRWLDMVANWTGTIIIFSVGFWLTAADTDNRDANNQIKHNTIALESKADKTYVDNSIREHEVSDLKNFDGLKELMEAYLKGQKELIQSIDKRLERLENKN